MHYLVLGLLSFTPTASPVNPDGPAKLLTLWTELADEDAGLAYRAMWSLVATPQESVALFRKNLRPAVEPDRKLLDSLITDLDSAQFSRRSKALREFEKLGELAGPALREARKRSNLSLETRVRLEQLIKNLHVPIKSPETLRALRAVEALEYIGSAEAKDLLSELASGAAGARLTSEAREALERLRKTAKP